MFRHKILLIVNLIFIFFIYSGIYSQNTVDSSVSKPYGTLRLKTDLTQWVCLYPNLNIEYRINKKWALNISSSYISTGIIWPLESLYKINDEYDYKYVDKKWLHGIDYSIGLKFYPSINKYISSQMYFNNLSFRYHSINKSHPFVYGTRKEYGIKFLYGIENKSQKHYFSELYFGIGLKYSFTNKHLRYITHSPTIDSIMFFSTGIIQPNICIGYNIGWKNYKNPLLRKERKIINRGLLKNSIYFEFLGAGYEFGSFNYERRIFNRNYFSITSRAGLNIMLTYTTPMFYLSFPVLLNGQFKISNVVSYEVGGGFLLNAGYLVGNTGFRFLGKRGFLFKVNFTPQYTIGNKTVFGFGTNPNYNLWFGISIGKSF
ncbi:MAG: hypothetical protein A2X08_13285 [Bacteroidetes bacterium GWA2_32_17]|nr:MAG: hypothetical protein A2X08_13285 [Bacteroidetes bacterium GWA2_32_17]